MAAIGPPYFIFDSGVTGYDEPRVVYCNLPDTTHGATDELVHTPSCWLADPFDDYYMDPTTTITLTGVGGQLVKLRKRWRHEATRWFSFIPEGVRRQTAARCSRSRPEEPGRRCKPRMRPGGIGVRNFRRR